MPKVRPFVSTPKLGALLIFDRTSLIVRLRTTDNAHETLVAYCIKAGAIPQFKMKWNL